MIIDKASKRPIWARRLDWVLSALMWLLYLYFIREALTDLYDLLSDSYDWIFAGAERPHLPVISRFLETLRDYSVVVVANGALLIVWALYNQLRFRGHDRHHTERPVTITDLAELYGRPAAEIAGWQQSRILVMQHDPDGTISGVVTRDVEPRLSTPDEKLFQP